MRMKLTKKTREDLAIILLPILVIMVIITFGLMSMSELGKWDMAISIGAMISLLLMVVMRRR